MGKQVEIYTDGACSGNPGPGGYCAILLYQGREKILQGGAKDTTNNRMELTAALEGMRALKEPCQVTLYSDSKYVIDALQKGWAEKWKANGWMRNKKDPALNADIWEALLAAYQAHDVTLVWVKGHSGNHYNERCDEIAVAAAEQYK